MPSGAPRREDAPWYHIQGVPNFRSVGGWPVNLPSDPDNSYHVHKHLIFRGSDPLRITHDGIQALRDLGIEKDFDLRSKQQVEKLGIRDLGEYGIERVWTPVFSGEEYSEEKAAIRYELYASDYPKDIVKAFVEILEAGVSTMRAIVNCLLRSEARVSGSRPAIFIHCTTGNNRTGVFVAMLLLLLHVSVSDVVYEYTMSEEGLQKTRHLNVARLLKKGAFKEYGDAEARRKCERLVSARAESMEALYEEIVKKWGGAEGYFKIMVGLSDEELARLRDIFIVRTGVED